MTRDRAEKLLRLSAAAALVALALMLWGLLARTPIPIMVSMSVGQALGTLSFGLFLFVVISDIRRARVLHQHAEEEQREGEAAAAAEEERRAEEPLEGRPAPEARGAKGGPEG